MDSFLLSLFELLTFLNEDEVHLMRELTQSSVLEESIKPSNGVPLEGKFIMMKWMDDN